jgi:hypothetical protein
MLSFVVVALVSAAVVSADITGTNPPSGACLCVTGSNVNVRGSACGTIIGSANSGQCFKYNGNKQSCVLSGTTYEFFHFDFNGQSGWLAGTYFNTGSDSQCSGGGDGEYTCYGDLTLLVGSLAPKGASQATANQDGLSYSGVPASNKMVENDLSELNAMRSAYNNVGRKLCVEPALVAAIASRESRAGRLLHTCGGWGDCSGGCSGCRAYGILQCDVYSSGLGSDCTSHHWQSEAHLEMMVDRVLIRDKHACVKAKHPTWLPHQQLQGAVAAYNFGCSNVQTWPGLDQGTTGNDYSGDVMARAQHLKNAYGW